MKHSRFADALGRDLESLGLSLEPAKVALLEQHWELVKAWNARVNLTSILDDATAAERHYADSLAALPVLPPGPIVDIGSGAGFPGLPLAVAEPERPVLLLEPRRKRASFLETAAARLGLTNIQVRTGRHADAPTERFAAAVTRATFSDPKELAACLAWVKPGGLLIAWRSSETGDRAARQHPYQLGNQARVLEIWCSPGV